MVEKAGHNKHLQSMRAEWINEGRPKTSVIDEGGDVEASEQTGDSAPKQAERIAPIFERTAISRQKTPGLDDLFGDEDDIYNATPIGGQKTGGAAAGAGDEPDEDELDALMAMEEVSGPNNSMEPSGGAVMSIFGDARPKAAPRTQAQPDEFDELDALIAEAEDEPLRQKPTASITKATEHLTKSGDAANAGEDDLDAMMAEAAEVAPSASKVTELEFNDDEEAMAEMDGLW